MADVFHAARVETRRPLTERQARVLSFVAIFHAERNRPPTRKEIADALGFASPNAAEEHLRAIEKKGYLHLARGTARGIEFLAA